MLAAASLLALVGSTAAHMEVQFPPPLKSKFNPHTPSGQADYSMTAPLATSGADFPCKGYQSLLGTSAGAPAASFAVGAKGNMTITGGANHNGGSCQISLSTDGARTFAVLQSYVGGCPATGTSNWDFTIPADAPTGDHVLAWTWHNQVGNREMYMNCASVTLTDGGAGAQKRMTKVPRAAAYASRPGIYIANVGPKGDGCETPETFDVEYPKPGPDVTNMGSKAKAPGCGVTQKVGFGQGEAPPPPPPASAGGSGNSSAPDAAAPSPPSASTPTPEPATTPAKPPVAPSEGSDGDSKPSAPGNASAPAPTSPSAGGGGAPASNTPGSKCAKEGEWACFAGGTSFQRCASGQWSVAMAVAPGTVCAMEVSKGIKIVAAGA